MPCYPFQIAPEDVGHNGVETEDVGRWAYLVRGCYQFFNTEDAALTSYREVWRN